MALVRIPLAPRSKVPLVPDWQNLAPDDPVWEAVARNVPDCNWGLRLDDFVVADCDSPEAVAFWMAECPVRTPLALVGNLDRMAFWYRRPEGSLLRTCRLRSDIEIRTGSGAQQAVPPSSHPHEPGKVCRGRPNHRYCWYAWGNGGYYLVTTTDFDALPEAPEEWILAQKPSAALWGDGEDGWDVIPEGGRNTALTAIGGLLRRHGAGRRAIENMLEFVNVRFCFPPLTDDELAKIAWSVSRYAPAGDVEVTWEEPEEEELVSLADEFRGYDGPRYIREGSP